MAKAVLVLAILFTIYLPATAQAEELLPAICQQVLAPSKDVSIPEIVADHITNRIKEIPGEIVLDTERLISGVASSIGKTLGAYKDSAISKVKSQVLGANTEDTGVSNFLNPFIRHWVWSLSGLGILAAWFILRL
ncbi:MAG: hypothetical protein AAB695_02050 [Patescibacteria group bacterium]